jgi:hypothetical protein
MGLDRIHPVLLPGPGQAGGLMGSITELLRCDPAPFQWGYGGSIPTSTRALWQGAVGRWNGSLAASSSPPRAR